MFRTIYDSGSLPSHRLGSYAIPPSFQPESRVIVSRFSAFLTSLLLVSAVGLAQDRGTIRGTVTDQSTAAVPEAVVTVRNVDTGLVQNVRTGSDGVYNVLYLPVGNYTVSTAKPGFRKAESTGIRVNVNTVVGVDISLTVGAVAEAVEVTAASPLLETQGSNLGKVVPTKAIMDLPLFISGGLRSNMSFIILT